MAQSKRQMDRRIRRQKLEKAAALVDTIEALLTDATPSGAVGPNLRHLANLRKQIKQHLR